MPAVKSAARSATARKVPAVKQVVTGRDSPKGQWLAFRKTFAKETPSARIKHIRHGAKAALVVGAASAFGVSREAIFSLVGLPASTANRKIAKKETLDVSATERLARLALIEQQAEDTFGDHEMARGWLQSANASLGGTPMSMLDTEIGAREVSKVLVAIAHGGAA